MSYINIRALEHAYGDSLILPRISLQAKAGDFVCLLGPSGSGKTTLLRLIAGLEKLQKGSIEMDGEMLSGSDICVPPEKRAVGMVFQQPTLFPTMNVRDNVGFGIRHLVQAERDARINQLLDHVGLNNKAEHYPHQLSGGQQHRVALARALAPTVKLLLLDEPFSHLDPQLRASLSRETLALVKDEGVTCMMVTHDEAEAMRMGDTIVLLDAHGHIRQSGTPHDLYHHPVDAYAALALGDINLLNATSDSRTVDCPLGIFDMVSNLSGAVQVGVRPHDCTINAEPIGVKANVQQVLCTGPQDHLLLQLQTGEALKATLPHDKHFCAGDQVHVCVPEDKLHVFAAA